MTKQLHFGIQKTFIHYTYTNRSKEAIKNISLIHKEELDYIAECYSLITKIVNKLELEKIGYSITTNGGNK